MQINNIQQFNNILKSNPIKHGIQKGDRVYGRIIGFSSGKILGIFNGVPLFAESRIPVKAGQRIIARVTDVVDGKLHISLLNAEDVEQSRSEGLKTLLNTLGINEDSNSLSVIKQMISQKLPLKKEIFQDAMTLLQKSPDGELAVSLFLRMYSRMNGKIPPELMSFLQTIDKKKFRQILSLQEKLPAIEMTELKELLAGNNKSIFDKISNIKDPYLLKMKAVIDTAYQMNSGFFKLDEEDSCCWLKEYVRYDKNTDITAYNLGIEVNIEDLSYFDILMTHIKTPDEKNLTIQFFDLESAVEEMIKDTSDSYLIDNLKIDYDNVYVNFSSGGSFSFFDPESIDIPSFTGNINIKV